MKQQQKVSCPRFNGFTLVEVLMTLTIVGLLAVSAFDVLRSGMTRVRQWSAEMSSESEKRVALALWARDIRCAYVANEEENTFFVGTPAANANTNRLDFTRRAVSSDGLQTTTWEVGYFLAPGAGPGTWDLCRRWKESVDDQPREGGQVHLLLSGLHDVRFRYFDGNRWSDEWLWDPRHQGPIQGIRGLPLFVRMEMDSEQWIVPVMTSVVNRALRA